MPQYTVDEEIQMLADADLLTERQAECYVHRRVEGTPGYAVADELDISESAVSDAVSAAESKLDAARATLQALQHIRNQTDVRLALHRDE